MQLQQSWQQVTLLAVCGSIIYDKIAVTVRYNDHVVCMQAIKLREAS